MASIGAGVCLSAGRLSVGRFVDGPGSDGLTTESLDVRLGDRPALVIVRHGPVLDTRDRRGSECSPATTVLVPVPDRSCDRRDGGDRTAGRASLPCSPASPTWRAIVDGA